MPIKVSDILNRPHFKRATVIAGQQGLTSKIRWVHVMEVTQIGKLLSGSELILSTGVGWKDQNNTGLSFLQQLIDKKASGLCVELGTYINIIPQSMIKLAEANDFPLIVFQGEVRFIDITQDLNGLLMETHYKMMADLESFSNKLNHLLLSTDSFHKILRLFSKFINSQVAYVRVEGEIDIYPNVSDSEIMSLKDKITECVQNENANTGRKINNQPIKAMGHKFADLVVINSNEEWTEFDSLILDRTATALAQEQLRALYIEEKRKQQEVDWIQKWLNGEHSREEINRYLSAVNPNLDVNGCIVCMCQLEKLDNQLDFTFYSMVFNSVFEQKGFFSLLLFERNQIVFALVNKRNKCNWKERLEDAVTQIRNTKLLNEIFERAVYGVGKMVDQVDQLKESYITAEQTISINQKVGRQSISFYDDLHIYRYLYLLDESNNLQNLVSDYLGSILEFDANNNSQMFETLKIFLEVNGSKKEAASRLFIVRQTLYHRLNKLYELLGEDFMQPEKRLVIELAVYTYAFLHQEN
ncbi:PucR family transcriptional regulator [Aquibacillus sp. 3ASR75-11]|uniref:PucR family transcriptional regulator n=1 Tax=Terrihalobacillus insolitus TaxID=2950438 RepID=A0A9X3WRH0_9BACI|nr:PucR family transcriptional regulator [Terrihalobacillus insolitus]MDC3424415.1 PucR family transcriptional regulator [Terrihalobacillus insolitus]